MILEKNEGHLMKKIPKHLIIENYIIDEIEKGNLKVGDQIMTEMQLSEKFDIGRLTVNKALTSLMQRGYIERTAGKGSFVSRKVRRSVDAKRSFTEDMRSIGLKAGSKLLEYRIIKGAEVPEIAKELQISEEDDLHFFIRLRTGNGEPFALAYTYLVYKLIPDLKISALDGSLDVYLESVNIPIVSFETRMSAVLPTKEQSRILELENQALLRSTSLRYTNNKVAYEYTQTYYIPNKFEYTFEGSIQ